MYLLRFVQRGATVPQNKFLDLVNLALTTTWYTFNSPASSTTAEIYMLAHERMAISTALRSPKVWERFTGVVYSILKCTHLENFFHHIKVKILRLSIFIKILRLLWRRIVMEKQRFLTVNNGIIERPLYWYIRRLHIVTNTYITAVTTKKLLFSPCLIEHILLSQINDLYKGNARIKQVLKKKMDIRKALLRELLTITACFSESIKCKPQIAKRKRSE